MLNNKKIDWTQTLNSLVHTHKYNDVVFKITDVEDLAHYIAELNETIGYLTRRAENLDLLANNRWIELKKLKEEQTTVDQLAGYKVYKGA